MKKLVGTLLISSLVASSIYADEAKIGGLQVGGNSTSVQHSSTSYSSMFVGLDGFVKMNKNFYLGAGIDNVFLGSTTYQNNTKYSYVLGAQLKLAYSLESLINWKANVKGEVGYGVTRFADTNKGGMQYGIGVEAQLYKSIGIGYKYKVVDSGFTYLGDLTSNIGYLKIAF